MPGHLNEEGIDVPVNLTLSTLDQAFIVLNYPGNTKSPMSITNALKEAGVSEDVSATILGFVAKKDYASARSAFAQYNMSMKKLHDSKSLMKLSSPISVTHSSQSTNRSSAMSIRPMSLNMGYSTPLDQSYKTHCSQALSRISSIKFS
jgi:hypothetical protein